MKKRSHMRSKLFILILFAFMSHAAGAKEIKGINIAEQVTQPETGQALILNGAGIRSKFIFDIYIGALYLPAKSSDAKQIMNSPAPKRVSMYFVYSKIGKEKMAEAWNEAFSDALDKAAFQALKARIDQFNRYFPDIVKGDKVVIDFVPGQGVAVSINGARKGVIAGNDFSQALLRIWLGHSPVDETLKDGMLGLAGD